MRGYVLRFARGNGGDCLDVSVGDGEGVSVWRDIVLPMPVQDCGGSPVMRRDRSREAWSIE